MAFLTSLNGAKRDQRHELHKDTMIFGRHPECDLVLEVGAVSRQHARIVRTGHEFRLEDLKSRNGTFLNGRSIAESTVLQDGDLIRMCDLEFSFHLDQVQQLYDSSVVRDGSSTFGVTMIDDGDDSASKSVTSRFDIRPSGHGSQLTTTAEVRLQAVLEIIHSLGRAVVLNEVLPKVLDSLFKIFVQADRAFIVLKEDDKLVPISVRTRQQDLQENFRISRTIMREVMESKQALITLDASADERFEMAQSVSDFRIRSMIVAPLLGSDDNAIGAIQLDTLNQRRRFEPSDLEILAAVAMQAGVAIENAQLHEKLVYQKLVEKDLELAKRVQLAFIPSQAPQLTGYTFYHYYQPADQVGGDYFDYIDLPDGRVAIIVADVVGHGVSAAMLMAKLSAETRFALATHALPSAAINSLNLRIHALGVQKFITFLCLVLEPATGHIVIVNAGHMAPLWKRSHDVIEEPGEEQTGLPVGITDEFEFEQATISLSPGERLVLYTDGINEAPNAAGAMFGIEKLRELLHGTESNVEVIGSAMVKEVREFIKGTMQADDMCLVVMGRE